MHKAIFSALRYTPWSLLIACCAYSLWGSVTALAAENHQPDVAGYATERTHLADLIFPESTSWPRFLDLPRPSPDELDPSMLASLLIAQGCDRASIGDDLQDARIRDSIRKISLYDDAKADLIFSGPSPCREGNATLIWRDFTAKAKPAWQVLNLESLLRIKPGTQPRYVEYEHGCCADITEAFKRGTLFQSGNQEYVAGSLLLRIPDGVKEQRRRISIRKPTDLRLSPSLTDNIVDPDYGPMDGGNISARLARLKAVQLLSYRDRDGRAWALILLLPFSRLIDGNISSSIGWIALRG